MWSAHPTSTVTTSVVNYHVSAEECVIGDQKFLNSGEQNSINDDVHFRNASPRISESKTVFKVLMVGDIGVGKTTYVQQYMNGYHNTAYKPTLGGKFHHNFLFQFVLPWTIPEVSSFESLHASHFTCTVEFLYISCLEIACRVNNRVGVQYILINL